MTKPRLLWYSNGVTSPSGYGTVTKNVVSRLRQPRFGSHDVWVVDNSHNHLSPVTIEGVPILPGGGGLCEAETRMHYYRGEFDWLLVLYDCWALQNLAQYAARERDFRVIAHAPSDHDQVYPQLKAFFDTSTLIVPYADYGHRLIKQAGFTPPKLQQPIPHGVDTSIFRPLDTPRRRLIQQLNAISEPIPGINAPEFAEDDVVIGIIKRNKDLRGWIPEQLEVFRALCDSEPDLNLKLYIHTQARMNEGHDLPYIAQLLGIADRVRFVKQYEEAMGIPAETMAQVYNACDAGMMLTSSEGYGLPTLEWASCGKPVVGTDCTTTTELLAWAPELRVKTVGTYWHFNGCRYWFFDKADAHRALREAVSRDPSHWQRRAVGFAKKYDYDYLVEKKWVPFMGFLEEHMTEACLRVPKQDGRWDGAKKPREVKAIA